MLSSKILNILRVDVLEVGHRAHTPNLLLNCEPLEGLDGRVHPSPVHGIPHRACVGEEGQLRARAGVVVEGTMGCLGNTTFPRLVPW